MRERFATIDIAEIPFAISNVPRACEWVLDAARQRRGVSVRLSNAYVVAMADSDHDYRRLLTESGVNFPDGAPVAIIMKLVCRREELAPARVRGPSLFEQVMEVSQGSEVTHFLMGATVETLRLMEAELNARFPGARIAGSYSPPFEDLTDAYIDECAAQVPFEVNLVWVGVGSPKQDYLSTALADRLGVPCVGVGAAFDFVAGTARQAPPWVQRLGAEWIYRLLTEPRRLWKRYFFGNAQFLSAVVRGLRRGRTTSLARPTSSAG